MAKISVMGSYLPTHNFKDGYTYLGNEINYFFSNAKIIVGPTGAGMANIIFAQKGCKIAVLTAATKNTNNYLFAQLSQYVGQVITYVSGKLAVAYQLQSVYKIDVSVSRGLVTEYIAVNIDTYLKDKFNAKRA